jgi:hypothetical protein
MSDDGSFIFFMSPLALTSGALNDVPLREFQGKAEFAQNVYEYHDGDVYLISDGRDTSAAEAAICEGHVSTTCLIGSDASGHNVFFTTADQLVPKDTDTELDFYDARICEPENGNPCIAEPPAPLPPCLGESCHGTPPERSSLLTGGSETLNGKGNLTAPLATPVVKPLTRAQKLAAALKACKKDKKQSKRQTCEKTARKKYGPVKRNKARKSSHEGRAK